MKNPKAGKRWKTVLRRIILLVIVLVLLGCGAWYGYDLLKQEYTTTYDAYTASLGSISNSLSFSGSMQLVNSAAYSASASGSVRGVYVQEGQAVRKGDKLLRLSTGETMTADFDGTVNQLYVSEGDDVAPGAQLIQLADFRHMKVTFRVDEYDINEVSVGTACRVTATATERTFPTDIASINYISASQGNVAYYTATAYVDVEEPGVYPGMQVTVTVPQEQAENVVVLKLDALSFTPQNSAYVFQPGDDGEMVQVPVEVGVSNGNYVEIRSGLKEGDVAYVVAAKTAQPTGLSSLFQSMFGTTRMNTPANRQRNSNGGNGSWSGGDRQWNGGNAPGGNVPSGNPGGGRGN